MQWRGRSEVTKAYLSKMFRCAIYEIASTFFGVGGGGKVTKAYLSEMFQNRSSFLECSGRGVR